MTTPTITPRKLDRMYPPPPWANVISGSYGDNERQGWAWDKDGYERNLFFQSGCVVAGMGESCDGDGSHYRCELPTLSVLEHDWEWVDDLEQVAGGILADIQAVASVAADIQRYAARMGAGLPHEEEMDVELGEFEEEAI